MTKNNDEKKRQAMRAAQARAVFLDEGPDAYVHHNVTDVGSSGTFSAAGDPNSPVLNSPWSRSDRAGSRSERFSDQNELDDVLNKLEGLGVLSSQANRVIASKAELYLLNQLMDANSPPSETARLRQLLGLPPDPVNQMMLQRELDTRTAFANRAKRLLAKGAAFGTALGAEALQPRPSGRRRNAYDGLTTENGLGDGPAPSSSKNLDDPFYPN